MKKTILTLLLFGGVLSSMLAVSPKILFYGYVVEGDISTMFNKSIESPALDGVMVTVLDGENEMRAVPNRTTGFFNLILDPGKKYTVKFEKEGYIPKLFQIDGSDIPEQDFEEGFKMFTDVTLFPDMDVPNVETLSKSPVAKCEFDNKQQKLIWDMDYAKIAFDHFLRVTGAEREFAQN